jgi:predicted CoA-binding protein
VTSHHKEVDMIDPRIASDFLAGHRLAVVGASDDPKNFGGTIFRALLDHGHAAVPVNPNRPTVGDHPCYPDRASIPGQLDGVVVLVPAAAAADVVRDAAAAGITKVWLFKGLGAPGAVSDEVLELCKQHGMTVVAGACPLMFLEPVGAFHRFHRAMRRLNHSVAKAA